MQIKRAHIKNFRGIQEVDVNFDNVTALLGSNNAGKSTILKALEIFFESAPKIYPEDHFQGIDSQNIEITVCFHRFTPEERREFTTAIVYDEMIVTRHLSSSSRTSGRYSARKLCNPDFEDVRSDTNGNQRRRKYRYLRQSYSDLPEISYHTEIEEHLDAWEANNLDKLEVRDGGDFFGATNVANGKLRKKTSLNLVPAVRDIGAEGADPKQSSLISLLDEITRQTFENRREMQDFLQRTKEEFQKLADPDKIPELSQINSFLNRTLQNIYPDSQLEAEWEISKDPQFQYPTPRVMVNHSGMTTNLARVGHGLQRASLFSIVRFLAERPPLLDEQGANEEFSEAASDIILLIEEPEIFQHPTKQFVISEALKQIVAGFNKRTGIRVQVVYTTHSEKFVAMKDFDKIRIVRNTRNEEGAILNFVRSTSIDQYAQGIANLLEPPREPMPDDAFIAKLHIFSREVCEGFFAEKVILVEGVTDKAVVEALFQTKGRDNRQESIPVISVEGKTKMDKPAYIFNNLGIPTYTIFDNDAFKRENKRSPGTNKILQRLWGETDPKDYPEGVYGNYCALPGDLESCLKKSMGQENFDRVFNEIQSFYNLRRDELTKNPEVMRQILLQAYQAEGDLQFFDNLIAAIDALT